MSSVEASLLLLNYLGQPSITHTWGGCTWLWMNLKDNKCYKCVFPVSQTEFARSWTNNEFLSFMSLKKNVGIRTNYFQKRWKLHDCTTQQKNCLVQLSSHFSFFVLVFFWFELYNSFDFKWQRIGTKCTFYVVSILRVYQRFPSPQKVRNIHPTYTAWLNVAM